MHVIVVIHGSYTTSELLLLRRGKATSRAWVVGKGGGCCMEGVAPQENKEFLSDFAREKLGSCKREG